MGVNQFLQIPPILLNLWQYLRFPLLAAIMFAVVGLLYAVAQDRKNRVRTIMPGVVLAMVQNSGTVTNEEAFWTACDAYLGCEASKDKAIHADFYRNEFNEVKGVCGFEPMAAQIVGWLKEKGIRMVLATNPLFPSVATENRIRWAGLQPEDFEYFTTFENSHYCKPNLDYYREILEKNLFEAGSVPDGGQ